MPAGEPGSAVPGGPRESAQAAALHYSRAAADAVRDAGAADSRLGAEVIGASVRRAIAAWVKGAEGDEAALAAVTRPEAVPALLHPPRAGERTRLVARNLLVTDILVDHLRADAEPPGLGVYADCRGLRYVESLATGSLLSGDRDADAPFVQFLRLTLDAPRPWPWRVSGGDTRLLTPPLDYMYSCRRETPAEYRARRGARTTPPPARGPVSRSGPTSSSMTSGAPARPCWPSSGTRRRPARKPRNWRIPLSRRKLPDFSARVTGGPRSPRPPAIPDDRRLRHRYPAGVLQPDRDSAAVHGGRLAAHQAGRPPGVIRPSTRG
jgi:hypothetical protein